MAARLFSGFVTFFSGVAVILAVVFIVYVVAYFADRLVCMNSAALTAEEFEERRNASPLTVQAGLAGLLSVERNQIFHAFFERRAFPYYKSTLEEERKQDNVYEQQETDIEAQATIVAGDKKGKVSSKRGKGRSFVAYSKGMEQESLRDEANEAELDALSEDDVNAPACSICLNEYGKTCLWPTRLDPIPKVQHVLLTLIEYIQHCSHFFRFQQQMTVTR